jgi:hypothetical protein
MIQNIEDNNKKFEFVQFKIMPLDKTGFQFNSF